MSNFARSILFTATAVVLLNGCAAVGVIESSKPEAKLRDADALLDHGRALPAERLIIEAIDIYKVRDDRRGLANGYRVYGLFFVSNAVVKYGDVYRRNGFKGVDESFEQRYAAAVKCFELSAGYYAEINALDALTNVYYQIGLAYLEQGEQLQACKAFESSKLANGRNIEKNPEAKVIVPSGYSNYATYIDSVTSSIGCGLDR